MLPRRPELNKIFAASSGMRTTMSMRSTGLGRVVLVVSVKKDGGAVIVDRASFAHGPVLMRFNATLA